MFFFEIVFSCRKLIRNIKTLSVFNFWVFNLNKGSFW